MAMCTLQRKKDLTGEYYTKPERQSTSFQTSKGNRQNLADPFLEKIFNEKKEFNKITGKFQYNGRAKNSFDKI